MLIGATDSRVARVFAWLSCLHLNPTAVSQAGRQISPTSRLRPQPGDPLSRVIVAVRPHRQSIALVPWICPNAINLCALAGHHRQRDRSRSRLLYRGGFYGRRSFQTGCRHPRARDCSCCPFILAVSTHLGASNPDIGIGSDHRLDRTSRICACFAC